MTTSTARGTVLDRFVTEYIFKGDTRVLGQLEQRVDRVKVKLDSFARTAGIVGGVAAAGLGLVSKAGLDTEEALLRTRAALGLTEDQMRTLRTESLRVGSALPLNTADIVNAQQAYGKLGATFDEIIRDIPAIAAAAVATKVPVDEVARYARIITNTFGGDVTQNLDIMLRIANNSAASFDQLGQSLQFSAQSAVDAGLSFNTYMSTLGGIAGAGREVQSVSQGLVGLFSRLAKSGEGIGRGGKIVATAFEAVGISMDEVNAVMDGSETGFLNLLLLIRDANLSTTQLTALMSTLAGDTYASSLSFAVQNPEMIRDLIEKGGSSAGEVFRQQEIILSGASGGIKNFLALIDTVLNRLSEMGSLDAIKSVTGQLNGMLTALTAVDEEGNLVNGTWLRFINYTLFAGTALLGLAIAAKIASFSLGPLFIGVKGLIALFAWLNSGTAVLTLQLYALSVAQRAVAIWAGVVAVATKVWTAAQWLLNVALTANPIGLIIVAIGLLIAAIAAAIIYWDEWTAKIREMPVWVKGLLILFGGWIAALAILAAHWDKVSAAVSRFVGWLRRIPGVGRLFGSGGDADEPTETGRPPGPPGDGDTGLTVAAGNFLSGLTAPLPVGVPPSASLPALSGAGGPSSYAFGDLNLTVNAPGADAQEIADNAGRLIDERLRRTVEAFDSEIAR